MKLETYQSLEKIYNKYGANEFGKLCQKLLAISFQIAGFGHIVERGVQGVDVDAAKGGEKYAIEVKTTKGSFCNFQKKDAEGLNSRSKDGYKPVLAVLRISLLSDWLLAEANHLKPGRLSLDSLRPYRLRDLENKIIPFFDQAVAENLDGILKNGQVYLDNILKKKGFEVHSS